jgi:hypothetical protein
VSEACNPLWTPDPSGGEVEFAGGYTIPNYGVRFHDQGSFALEVMALTGADSEHSRGFLPHEQTERFRTCTLTVQLSFDNTADGTPIADNREGWAANWADLEALSDATMTGDGTQTITYTPWTGATPVTFAAHVMPPTLVSGTGDGVFAKLDVILLDPDELPDAVVPAVTGDCRPGWTVDTSRGELRFDDPWGDGEYVIPNHAVRFVDEDVFRLGMRQVVGDDVETVDAAIPYPRVEKNRVAPIPLQMDFTRLPDGTAVDPAIGWRLNWRTLCAIAARSKNAADHGLQPVDWYPHDGRPDMRFQAHVAAPTLGAVTQGRGAMVGVIVTIPDPSSAVTL